MAFDFSKITNEANSRAPKGIVYGPPGIGKTTFGHAANGLILDVENGIPTNLGATRTHYLPTWKEIKEFLDWFVVQPELPPALVVDTIDWLLRRVEEHVSGAEKSLDNSLNKSHDGFGNGQQILRNYVYQYLLPIFDKIVNRGTAVVLLAHTERRDMTSQEGATYERSVPQIHKTLANIMIEWSDFVGAATMQGGQRTLVLQETGQLIAKNRYGITQPIPLDWNVFVQAICGSNQ